LDVAARTEAIDWIRKLDSVFDLLIEWKRKKGGIRASMFIFGEHKLIQGWSSFYGCNLLVFFNIAVT
jgi:hypothetical protein